MFLSLCCHLKHWTAILDLNSCEF